MARVMTEEHKLKMREGRANARRLRESLKTADKPSPLERLKEGEKLSEPERMAAENMLRSQMTENMKKELNRSWSIDIDIDWHDVPMNEAQEAYSILRTEFEKAGRILNERSMPAPGSYKCFMCQIVHPGDARGKDDSYEDPETKLRVPIRICSELCWISYQDYRIKERSFRNDYSQGLIDFDGYIAKTKQTLSAMRTLQNQKVLKTA